MCRTYNLGTNSWTDTTDSSAVLVTHDAAGDDYVIRIDRPTEMSSQTLGTDIDGDGYEEFMGVVDGAPRWRAYFDSQYLPDGITELHYIVYDLAGNAVHRMREVFIANNGPDMDRIRIGSDINASGDVADLGDVSEIGDYFYPAGSVDRTDTVKVKNDRIYLNVLGSDPNGTVDNIYVDVYDATGVNRYGTLSTNGSSPLTAELTVNAGASPWNDGYGVYNLKVIVRDNDQISRTQWVKIELIDPSDVTDPVVTLNGLSQADQDYTMGHLELSGDYDAADWAALASAYGDDDPKASGVLYLTGTVSDENRIELITGAADGLPETTLANWVGGELVSHTADFVITSQSLKESGHDVSFIYAWDTSNISNTADLDQLISFGAQDGGGNTASPASQQVDVVPYITSVSRDSGIYNTYRSRQGRFILRQAEEVIFTGFNIFNSTADRVTLSNTSGGTTGYALPGGSTADSFVLASLNSAVTSGDVTVTVNGLVSINNLNDNGQEYNQEATASAAYDNSWLWTDDRAIHVWLSDDKQTGGNRGYFTGSEDPEYPAMAINDSGILYGSWSNYAESDIMYGTNNGGANTVFHGYDPSEHTDISFGNRATVVFNANLYNNGGWSLTNAGGTYIWDSLADERFTGSNDVYAAEALYHDEKLMQFINQRIVADGDNIHTAYYDTDTKALKYYLHLSGNNSGYQHSWINIDGGYDGDDQAISSSTASITVPANGSYTVTNVYVSDGQFVTLGTDILTLSNGLTYTAGYDGTVNLMVGNSDTMTAPWYQSRSYDLYSLTGTSSRIVDEGGSTRTAAAGEFSAIDVMPATGYPVIAYYDITNKTVKLARANNATPDQTQWTLQTVMAADDDNFSYSGKYITMKIDSQGYVHLAFYRNSTGDLVYMKSTNHPTDGSAYTFGESVIVDSIGSVGVWADLTLENDEPVISYLDSSLVNTFDGIKMAYYDSALETTADEFTGESETEPDTLDGWETMNAALGFEVESVRTSIEADTGSNDWSQAIGYSSNDYFRIGYYLK